MLTLQGGMVGDARIIERAFGVGPCVLTGAMVWLQDRLGSAKTWRKHGCRPALTYPDVTFAEPPVMRRCPTMCLRVPRSPSMPQSPARRIPGSPHNDEEATGPTCFRSAQEL